MSDQQQGNCLCGEASYLLSGAPKTVAICHCSDCQKNSGSAFATLMLVTDMQITVSGKLHNFSKNTDSGGRNTRFSCANCHSLICEESSHMPGHKLVSVGTLSDSSWVKPKFHCWVSSKQSWLEINDDLPQFNKGPKSLK